MSTQFIPLKTLDEMIEQARRDIEAWNNVYTSFSASKGSLLHSLAGPLLPSMMQSPQGTKAYLEHPDPSLRMAAALLVYNYWLANELFAPACLRLAFNDPDQTVRGVALLALTGLCKYIYDPTGSLKPFFERLLGNELKTASEIARSCVKKMVDMKAVINKTLEEEWLGLVGPSLELMLQGPDATERYLEHEEENLRYVAISIMDFYWGPTRRSSDICVSLLSCVADIKVHSAALRLLGTYYAKTDDLAVGRLLASIVREDSRHLHLRRVAYLQLFRIRGMPFTVWPKLWPAEFRFPEEVDWSFVDSFMR